MATLPISLTNANFEADTGTTDGHGITITGWPVVSGGPATVVKYGSGTFPGTSDPGPPGTTRGLNFAGGGKVASSVIHQTLDFTGYETEIDAGHVSFFLSAYLGGCPDQDDNVKIDLVWKTATGGGGSTISTSTLPAALLVERGAINGMIFKSTSGAVPANARSVDVKLTFTRLGGTDNDGYVDNIVLRFESFEGTRAVADYIEDPDYQTYEPFFYVKFNGLPYYFFCGIDPTDTTKYGDAAWTLPTGFSAVQGMILPTSPLDQALPNIIGGIASAERITVDLLDFDVMQSTGSYSFFGRLIAASGRFIFNTSTTIGQVTQDIEPDDTGAVLRVLPLHSGSGDFVADDDVYIGGETIGISTVSTSVVGSVSYQVITVTERNKYQCHSGYPAKPFYHVEKDPDGNVILQTAGYATQGGPFSFIGRAAALYIGHLMPDGRPEPEANSLCRLIGHVKGLAAGKEPNTFSVEIESVMANLGDTAVAPHLAHAELLPGIHILNDADRSMSIGVSVLDSGGVAIASKFESITVAAGTYTTLDSLIHALNLSFAASDLASDGFLFAATTLPNSDGPPVVIISCTAVGSLVGNLRAEVQIASGASQVTSGTRLGLLFVLGFDRWQFGSIPDLAHPTYTFTADRPAPVVYIPGNNVSAEVFIRSGPDANGQRFFTDQGDGTGNAYVRFSTGQIGRLTDSTTNSITLIGVLGGGSLAGRSASSIASAPLILYAGDALTVEQVIHISPSKYGIRGSGDDLLPALLASKGYDKDTEYNIFPVGVGLGFDGILDKDSFREAMGLIARGAVEIDIDSSMKFSDLFTGYAKERGMFLVWDPATESIACRTLDLPNFSLAGDYTFSTSNRSKPDDRSQWQMDTANLRTSWTMKFGWNGIEKKFLAPELTINDPFAMQTTGQKGLRTEAIEDRLIPSSAQDTVTDVIASLVDRFRFTRNPWMKIKRTINKTGLLLSPGKYQKIVDPTLINPFTGILGIDDDDELYAYVFGVRTSLGDGKGEVTLLLDRSMAQTLLRPYSPVGLLDFSGGHNGYNTLSGQCTMARRYCSSTDTSKYDGVDFRVGDKVALVSFDDNGAPLYEKKGTVTGVSADGATVVIDIGLGAVSASVETLMILQDWADATTDRRTGDNRVSFQGDGDALLIDGTDQLHKWT
jgi:hypothetical protein